ncbi:MAG: ABC transporter permease [Treponema sp.]|jgi:simple sugar transport system permease protein|nr:ABC transporter permease [Treponema sp.]
MLLTIKLNKIENRLLEIFTGSNGAVSALAVFLGFVVATLLLLVIGRNPSGMYQAIFQVVSGFDSRRSTWNVRYVGEWIVVSLPLILCGLSMGFSARSGLFNIGAEGQYIAGLTAAQFIAVSFAPVPVIHLTVAVLGAILAGAVWGGIAGFLKARYKVSEVVTTIMMNYIALYVHRIITLGIPGSNTFKTVDFPATVSLSNPVLSSITNNSRLNNGLWLTIIVIFIYWLIMEKSTFGFSLRAAGFNKEAALYAGIRVKTNITIAMAISGAFAGLAGAVVSLGVFTYGRVLTTFENYGFDGIAVALGGSCSAIGIGIVGLLFGMLKSAQPLMQSRQIPREIASIIMGLVVVFISLRSGIQMFVEWRRKENTRKKEED